MGLRIPGGSRNAQALQQRFWCKFVTHSVLELINGALNAELEDSSADAKILVCSLNAGLKPAFIAQMQGGLQLSPRCVAR
jgi:hypothetical protein